MTAQKLRNDLVQRQLFVMPVMLVLSLGAGFAACWAWPSRSPR